MVRLLIAGDFAPKNRIAEMMEKSDYSFFEEVRQCTSQVDYSILNLECPIADENCKPIIKSGPNLKCSPKVLDAIKFGGFDGVTLANNHFRDYGDRSVLMTLKALDDTHIDWVGGGNTLRNSRLPLFVRIKEKNVGIVNVCEREFSIATKYTAGAAPIDLIDTQRTIAYCKTQADYVIVITHGGHELHQLPSPMMQKTYRWFIDMGADAVVNHHQHCYSGYEIYNEKPIFYGLGNFCFDKPVYRNSVWNEGFMVVLNLADKIGFDLIPYVQCDEMPTIRLKKESEIEEFNHSIAALNNIIADPLLVEADFERYCKASQKRVLGLLSPLSNRYLRGAAQKGLIPFFLSKKRIARIFDNINCDAHRNIILRCLYEAIGQ